MAVRWVATGEDVGGGYYTLWNGITVYQAHIGSDREQWSLDGDVWYAGKAPGRSLEMLGPGGRYDLPDGRFIEVNRNVRRPITYDRGPEWTPPEA